MTGVVLVGVVDADPLLAPLSAALEARGHAPLTLSASALASARITCGSDWCTVEDVPVRAVVFRASPALLVAPEFGEADAAFAASEVRAVWAHVLALPQLVAVNRACADTWFSSSAWSVWRRRLDARGVALAPRRIGRPYRDGWWVRWTGGCQAAPDERAAERLGIVTVAGGALRSVLCCAGTVFGDDAPDTVTATARALSAAGLVLANVVVDDAGRLVTLDAVPPIPSESAGPVADTLAEWIDAALHR